MALRVERRRPRAARADARDGRRHRDDRGAAPRRLRRAERAAATAPGDAADDDGEGGACGRAALDAIVGAIDAAKADAAVAAAGCRALAALAARRAPAARALVADGRAARVIVGALRGPPGAARRRVRGACGALGVLATKGGGDGEAAPGREHVAALEAAGVSRARSRAARRARATATAMTSRAPPRFAACFRALDAMLALCAADDVAAARRLGAAGACEGATLALARGSAPSPRRGARAKARARALGARLGRPRARAPTRAGPIATRA